MTHYFFSGIGGSGMLPLAQILKNQGHMVSGSDRAYDQGRNPEKYQALIAQGITLYPQDGSGLHGTQDGPELASPVCMAPELAARPDYLVISTAVEADTPDVMAAKNLGITIVKRAELLAKIFNQYPHRIAVGGTSGKTTTTGMIGFLLNENGMAPVVMNGGIFKNYGTSSLCGQGEIFVTEADESDGSIELYNPEVAVLNNISIDHKSMDELRVLFKNFTAKARYAVINADNEESLALADDDNATLFSLSGQAAYNTSGVKHTENGIQAIIHHNGEAVPLALNQPGLHNLSNALAAIAAVAPYGISLKMACDTLNRFQGIKRRMEIVGTKNNITVMDDFAHNPDKISASLSALHAARAGRLLVIFQMHGYGPLKLMWQELADAFADHLGPDDHVFMPPPLYLGGTVDRTLGTEAVVERIGARASWHENREEAAKAALAKCQAGDRIIIMGARDDTLSTFAAGIVENIQ